MNLGGTDTAADFAIDSQDQIVLAGSTVSQTTNIGALALVRLTADGLPDPAFGTGGSATVVEGIGGTFTSVDADSAGNLVGVGSTRTDSTSPSYLTLARFDAAVNSIQRSEVTVVVRPEANAYRRAEIQADDRIVVVGNGYLYRFNVDGSPDTAVGTNGRVELSEVRTAHEFEIGPDGACYLAGTLPTNQIGVARYLMDGLLDVRSQRRGIQRIRRAGGSVQHDVPRASRPAARTCA